MVQPVPLSESADSGGPATRRDEPLKVAKQRLREWRYETWMEKYSQVPYGPEGLLPDNVIDRIASNARIRNVDDFKSSGWLAGRAERHGEDILKLLKELDREVQAEKDAEKAAKEAEKVQ
ncbi:hypothetical protein HYDPIDRAFT_93350, partial [Hydnomerulius pinastri MD-312]